MLCSIPCYQPGFSPLSAYVCDSGCSLLELLLPGGSPAMQNSPSPFPSAADQGCGNTHQMRLVQSQCSIPALASDVVRRGAPSQHKSCPGMGEVAQCHLSAALWGSAQGLPLPGAHWERCSSHPWGPSHCGGWEMVTA